MAEQILNAVVVGVGRMGQHHARNYAGIEGYKLVGVVDQDAGAREKVSGLYKCLGFESIDALLAWCGETGTKIQAASIALPTIHHRAAAERLLKAGVDVLVEKPLAASVADARAIVKLARELGRVLAVGHTERFNPVYRALEKYKLQPAFAEVTRVSPMTFRSIDIGVVLDMMIHDIDLVNHLIKQPVVEVRAVGVAVVGKYEDVANARLTFANGSVCNMTASRLALRTDRRMRLFSPTGYASLDYQKKVGAVITKTANEKELERVRTEVAEGRITDLMQLNYAELIKYEELVIDDVEPVKVELMNFGEAIRTRRDPEVTGEDGAMNVELATRIIDSLTAHKWLGAGGEHAKA